MHRGNHTRYGSNACISDGYSSERAGSAYRFVISRRSKYPRVPDLYRVARRESFRLFVFRQDPQV